MKVLGLELVLAHNQLVQEVESNELHGHGVRHKPHIVPVRNIRHGLENTNEKHRYKSKQAEKSVASEERRHNTQKPHRLDVREELWIGLCIRVIQNGLHDSGHIGEFNIIVVDRLQEEIGQSYKHKWIQHG